ncbi:hypothetical protein RRV45_03750 [Bacillus sp. DTU_2020_1000418_1_SI_GHA_SEK_038]|nr:hypothetical protein [Bacillus sp. DTU_2020_1000418_1_SI_GHA_SEK_038]WNS76138.1 hypothetical protein RRV45_03750 [Bacillus sp. DTU_2020_1000418_1_SI_GHA_SEK_038]
MKEKQKDNKKVHEAVSDEKQLIREFANPESNQPVPQPKDFEDIEY